MRRSSTAQAYATVEDVLLVEGAMTMTGSNACDFDNDETAEIDLLGVSSFSERVVVTSGETVIAEYPSLAAAEEAHGDAPIGCEIRRLADVALLSTRTLDGWLREAAALPSDYAIAETAVEP